MTISINNPPPHHYLHQILTCLFFILILLPVQTFAFPKHNPKQGGISLINVASVKTPKPQVTYKNWPVTVMQNNDRWIALVGIPLNAKRGTHYLSASDLSGNTKKISFQVKDHRYRLQRLTIRNKNKVNPNKRSVKRIVREMKLKKRLKQTFSPQQPDLNFIKPIKGRDSGRFGLRRMINNQKRNPHSGMDIAAKKGTPIKAASGGRILHVGNFFFSGKVVYIDHGLGVISLYAHMNNVKVKPDQWIKKGDVIGTVGKTGRATGPHLHWSVYLNQTAVDPALFIN